MIFNTEIIDTLEIKTKKQAKETIKEYIDEFFELEKEDGVWGQLVLIFKDHQEVYDIDDPFDDLLEEENNPFDELRKEIITKDLIGSIYVHYDDEDSDTRVTCGIASIFLNCYIEGYKDKEDEKVTFSDEDLNAGLRGDPWEITRWIDYYKGCQYSEELVKNFNTYMGEDDEFSHFPMPMNVEGWGDCHVFVYDPKSIFRLFKRKVKNDYIFYVLDTGEIVVTTALSYKYTLSDSAFVRDCRKNGDEYGSADIFQTGLYYKGKHLFACHSDMSEINAIKLFKSVPKNEDNELSVSVLLKANIGIVFEYLENYCNEVCKKYER